MQENTVNGLFLLDKHEGITSHTAVKRVQRLFDAPSAGHTGTLDPLATGVLPILLGRAVKASEFLVETDKHYEAVLRLGVTTDTEDMTGTILTKVDVLPSADAVLEAAMHFVGEILQTPPMYSAIRVDGRRLMELAREGKTVWREPRPITVHSLSVTPLSSSDYRLRVVCSKGTYIRTLCADIGAYLGCGGAMASLRRTETAGFSIDRCMTLEELEALSPAARMAHLLPVESLFSELQVVQLSAFYARLAHSGQEIYLSKIKRSLPLQTRVRLYDEQGFFALGEVRDFSDGAAIKPIKLFRL